MLKAKTKYDKQLSLHYISHEEIQKYMFIFLLITSVQIFYVDLFVNQTGTEMTREVFLCIVYLLLIHIYFSRLLVYHL